MLPQAPDRAIAAARRGLFVTAAARFLAAVPLAAFLLCNAAADSQPPTRINGVMYLGDLPTVVADRQGFFDRRNLNAVVAYEYSGKRNLELLRAGRTDFALMALTPMVLDALSDPDPGEADDPVILASVVHSTRLNQVVALAGAGIDAPVDLRGRRVGLMKGTNAEFVWWLFAAYHGFDPLSVTLVDNAIADLPAALINGDVDSAVIWEPWTSRLRQRAGSGLRTFAGSNVYTAKWVVVALRGFVERHPERARAVLMAYREAIEFIDRHPDAAMQLYSDHDRIPVEALRPSWDALVYELSLDWSLIATLQQQLDWARRAGYASSLAEPGVLRLLAPGPLRSVVPVAVSVPGASALEAQQ